MDDIVKSMMPQVASSSAQTPWNSLGSNT
jgi:hypothetical protein